MDAWRRVWRDGLAPGFSTAGLTALRDALADDDPALLQGATTDPPALPCVAEWPVKGCCPISYVGWKGGKGTTVGEVEGAFATAVYDADYRLGFGSAREFIRFADDTPRDTMRAELLKEVELALAGRLQGASGG